MSAREMMVGVLGIAVDAADGAGANNLSVSLLTLPGMIRVEYAPVTDPILERYRPGVCLPVLLISPSKSSAIYLSVT